MWKVLASHWELNGFQQKWTRSLREKLKVTGESDRTRASGAFQGERKSLECLHEVAANRLGTGWQQGDHSRELGRERLWQSGCGGRGARTPDDPMTLNTEGVWGNAHTAMGCRCLSREKAPRVGSDTGVSKSSCIRAQMWSPEDTSQLCSPLRGLLRLWGPPTWASEGPEPLWQVGLAAPEFRILGLRSAAVTRVEGLGQSACSRQSRLSHTILLHLPLEVYTLFLFLEWYFVSRSKENTADTLY